MQLISERMGVFDMLDIVRENSWKAGIEQKERRLEKVGSAGGKVTHHIPTIDMERTSH